MREGLQPGAATTRHIVVGPDNTADAVGNPGVRVFSTPALLLLAEQTAYQVVQPYLEEGEGAVGTRVELDHLAPALPGAYVTCTARLTRVEGRRLYYDIEARDAYELLARGRYCSYVLLLAPFLERAARKGAG